MRVFSRSVTFAYLSTFSSRGRFKMFLVKYLGDAKTGIGAVVRASLSTP